MKYQDLIERVRAATGPDRELDAAVIAALGFHEWAGRMSYPDGPMWIDFASSTITASVDAAFALVDRKLPFKPWVDLKGVGDRNDGRGSIWIVVFDGAHEGRSSLLPIAIILALLTTLQPNEATNVEDK